MSSVSSSSSLTPNSFESTVSSFLSFPDSPSLSLSSSFDQVLHNLLSSTDDSVQDQLIDRTLERVSLLLESTKQCFRKRTTLHNSISWLLPPDLTIQVFSMLDTKSVIQASACCTMFNKYAMDPSCYTDIDLTTAFKHVDNGVVSTMIHRVGKKLRSLKLGCPTDDESFMPLLTSYCFTPLVSINHNETTWSLLRTLHIFRIQSTDMDLLCAALSICTNLTDLKIVGTDDTMLDGVLRSLSKNCPLIEHLFLKNCDKDIIKDSTIEAFVINCPNLTSLTLINFELSDAMAQILVKGFRKLKYMDLSSTYDIDGSFLRDLGHSHKNGPLETLILWDCFSLEGIEVSAFLLSLIKGDFKCIRYIDVSSEKGLACLGSRTCEPSFPLETLKEARPEVTFVADFPSSLSDISEEDIGAMFV